MWASCFERLHPGRDRGGFADDIANLGAVCVPVRRDGPTMHNAMTATRLTRLVPLVVTASLLLAMPAFTWAATPVAVDAPPASTVLIGGVEWSAGPGSTVASGQLARQSGDTDKAIALTLAPGDGLKLERTLSAHDRKGLAFSALLGLHEAQACLKLEILFLNPDGRELGREESDCALADGGPHPVAVVARPPATSSTVTYTVRAMSPATVSIEKLRTEGVESGLPGLRSLVAAPVLDALDEALASVRRRSMNRSLVEWDFVAARATAEAVTATRTRELLPAVRLVVKALGDGHSWATVLDDAGRMTLGSAAKAPPLVLPTHVRHELAPGRQVVQIRMTPLGSVSQGDSEAYADALRQALVLGAESHACAYVLDLRAHTGGNMWPGLAGLAPLLGPGSVGAFKPGPEWVIGEDGAYLGGVLAAGATVPGTGLDGLAIAPVALLFGPKTASSGEAIAIAFAGRANTRSFGSKTRGLATANQMIDLGDGLRAFVAVGLMLDRHQRTYPTGLLPDIESEEPDEAESDALSWARSLDACKP